MLRLSITETNSWLDQMLTPNKIYDRCINAQVKIQPYIFNTQRRVNNLGSINLYGLSKTKNWIVSRKPVFNKKK